MSSFLSAPVDGGLRAQGSETLLVAGAADLAPAEAALAGSAGGRLGMKVRFVLGSSGQLATQIRNGAPYDVFLSANMKFVRDLAGSGHVMPESVRTYSIGRLALYSKDGKYTDVRQLAGEGVRHVAIANPAHAPYGVAAKQLLERAGVWEKLASRVVYGENVRQTFQFAESGNADAAVVAWTLVKDRGGVLLAESGDEPIAQGAGVVARSGRAEAGRRFVEWLMGEEGQGLLREAGLFGAPGVVQVKQPEALKKTPGSRRRRR